MAYQYPAAKMVHAVFGELGEEVRDNSTLSVKEVLAFLNDGERKLARASLCLRGTMYGDLVANTALYDPASVTAFNENDGTMRWNSSQTATTSVAITDLIDNAIFSVEVLDADAATYRTLQQRDYWEVLDSKDLLKDLPAAAPLWWTWDPDETKIRIGPKPPLSISEANNDTNNGLRVRYAQVPTEMLNYVYDSSGTVAVVTTAVTGTGTTWETEPRKAAGDDLFGTTNSGDPVETLPNQWSAIESVDSDTEITLATSHTGPTIAGSQYLISSPCSTASKYSDMADVLVAYAKAQAVRRFFPAGARDEAAAGYLAEFDAGVARLKGQIEKYAVAVRGNSQ